MASGKNTVVVYKDWIKIFNSLEEVEAGRLVQHFFKYINDENPVAPDRITELTFIPIKTTLKRNLKEWEKTIQGKSDSGALGNIKRWHSDLYPKIMKGEIDLHEALEVVAQRQKTSHSDGSRQKSSQTVANVAVTVTVTDTDIINIIAEKEKELFASTRMIQNTAIKVGLKEEEVNVMLKDFVLDQKAKDVIHKRPLDELKQHFVNKVTKSVKEGKINNQTGKIKW